MAWDVLFPDLSRRMDVPELMDDPTCSDEQLFRTLQQFRRLNRLVTGYRSVLNRWLIEDMLTQPGRTYRVADLGAGGCDIPAWLLQRARSLGLKLSVLAVESNARVTDFARQTYGGTPGLEIVCRDALDLGALGTVDYIMGNHFLHHLTDGDITELLARALRMRIRRFVFQDLARSYPAYYLHSLLAALIFRGSFVGTDGRRSIRRGFRAEELNALVCKSGIAQQVKILRMMPARVVIIGSGSGSVSRRGHR